MSTAASRRRALAVATALPERSGTSAGHHPADAPPSLACSPGTTDPASRRKASARRRLQSKSAKAGRQGRKGETASPLQWQQVHSPTQAVTFWEVLEEEKQEAKQWGVKAPAVGRWRAVRRQQRVVEAKLWRHLTPGQQAAAERIYGGFARLSRGLGAGRCALGTERVDGAGRPDPDFFQAQVRDYLIWGRRCQQEAIDQAAVMAVLGEGRSCLEVDRQRRRRKGYARAQLGEGLSLYCLIKGWNPG